MTDGRPLERYWAQRRVTGAEVMKMIDELDPVEHDVEITHLSQEVLVPPFLAYLGYAAGFARVLGNPAAAYRTYRDGTGDQILKSTARDVDTLTYFGLMMRLGYRSPEAQRLYDRVQDIHRSVKGVGNDSQLHTLGMLIFDQERFTKKLGHRWFTDKENEARFNFWTGVGKAMRLRDVPETRQEFLDWIDSYEKWTFRPSIGATETFKGQLNGIAGWVPRPMAPVARYMLIEGVEPDLRELFGFRARVSTKPASLPAIRAVKAVRPYRRYRLDRTWVSNFSRDGQHPDLSKIGYQPKG